MDLQNIQSNTIDSIQITGAEYVIIKNLSKEYQLIKDKLIDEITEEILQEIQRESNEKILKK
jgi:hypothetical protein